MHVLSAQDFAYRSNRCFQFCQPSLCSCLPCYHQQRQIEAEDIVLFPIPLKPITNPFGFYPRQQKFTYGAFLSYATSVNHYSGSLTCSMPPFFFAVWSNLYTLSNWMNVVDSLAWPQSDIVLQIQDHLSPTNFNRWCLNCDNESISAADIYIMCKFEIYVTPQIGIPFVHALPSIKIFQKHSYRALLFSSFNMDFLFLKNIHLFYLAENPYPILCQNKCQ